MQSRTAREILTYLTDDLVHQLSTVRTWLVVGAYVLFNLLMTLPYVSLSNFVMRKLAEEQGATMLVHGAGDALWVQAFTKLTGDPVEGAAMASIPMPAMYVFTIAAAFVPLLALLMTSDLVAEELHTGHIRYLTLRSARSSLLFGKLLSRMAILAVTVLLVALGCFLVFHLELEDMDPGAFPYFLRFGFILVALVPVWAGLAALCSTMVKGPFIALLLGIFSWMALGVLDSTALGALSPGHYKLLLYSPNRWWHGVLAVEVFAMAFMALAWLRLRTRDL